MTVATDIHSGTGSGSNAGDSALPVRNPYTLKVVATLRRDGAAAVEAALSSCHGLASDRDSWPPRPARIGQLERAAALVASRAEAFADTIVRESGKPLSESRAEVADAVESLKQAVAVLRTDGGAAAPADLTPESATRRAFVRPEPVGVVIVVGDYDRPLDGIVRPVAAAVATGCPVVVRPSPETPLSAKAFVEALRAAGLPRERVTSVVTDDESLLETLCVDPRAALVHFTGAPAAGWRLRAGLASGTRCVLDLGASPAVIVGGDADVYEVREAVLGGCFIHAGQARNAVKRIFAHTKIATRFATQLAMKASGLLVGDPAHEGTAVGPVIRPETCDQVHELVREALDGGGQLLTGGEKLTETLYAPTVIFNPPQDCRLMTEPVRGPVVCVDPWFRLSEALERANGLAGAGAAAVFARSVETAMEIAEGLAASVVMINDHTAFAPPGLSATGRNAAGLGGNGIADLIRAMQTDKTIVLRTDPLFAPPDAEPA